MGHRKNYSSKPHYYSDKLKHKLDKLRFAPASVIVVTSDYGKSMAIRNYLEARLPRGAPVYWFNATDGASGTSFKRLCQEIKKIDRNVGERLFNIGLPNAATIGEATDALRSIRCTKETYLVINNFQFLDDIVSLAFFTALFEHSGEGLHVIVATQMLEQNMLAVITGHGFLHISTADLRLSAEEICRYYVPADARITLEGAREIARYTNGWILVDYLQHYAFKETGKFSNAVGLMAFLERFVWHGLTEKQKTFLLYLSPFAKVTVRQACTIIGCSILPEYALDALAIPFIRYEPVVRRYVLHSILTELLIKKRGERGVKFERECLLQAGDLCRNDGKTIEALGFYMQIRSYDRILSLDLSHMTLATIHNMSFAELAQDIACNCPINIKKRHIISMLRIAWALYMNGMEKQFEVLMEELHTMHELSDNSYFLGEWLLLYSYMSFPNIVKMTAVLRQAVPLFGGKCSQVILPTVPWCRGNFSPLSEFHIRPGEAERNADALEKYIAIYSRLTNGHGKGADVLYRAELAFFRGEISEIEILSYKAAYLAKDTGQNIVQLGAMLYLADVALHKKDTAGWQHAIDSMEQVASLPSQDTFVSRAALDIIRGVLLNELEDQTSIADWLKKTDFNGQRILAPMTVKAMFVHLSFLMHQGEYARVIGIGKVIMESDSWGNPIQKAFLMLIIAVCYKAMGYYTKASVMVKCAGELLLPDGLIFPFVSYSWILGEMVTRMIEKKYPQFLGVYQNIRECFGIGWVTLRETFYADELPTDLTSREYEVAKLAAEGLRNSEIAQKLMITESTVRTHLRATFQKLQIDRRAKLVEKLK